MIDEKVVLFTKRYFFIHPGYFAKECFTAQLATKSETRGLIRIKLEFNGFIKETFPR